MMNINKALELVTTLQSQSVKKSEKKVYKCFIRVLSSLKQRDLTEKELQLIEEKLFSLNLEVPLGSNKKYYRQKLCEFKNFLLKEFSLSTEKHYTELGVVYGMSMGVAIGLSVGIAINPVLGSSFGLSIGIGVGMLFGMLYGAAKDANAKRLGNVI